MNLISDDESEWEKDPAVQAILQQSTSGGSETSRASELTMEDLIKQHRAEVYIMFK